MSQIISSSSSVSFEIDTVYGFQGQNIRVFGSVEKPSFVVKDLCDVLGITNVSNAVKNIPIEWKGDFYKIKDSNGHDQTMITVSEPGLYKLVMRSNKLVAEKFQKWVCEEVLPSIRKKGEFVMEEYKKKIEAQQILLEESHQENQAQQILLEKKDEHIKKLQRETQVIDGKNVVYLSTSEEKEKEGVYTVGRAINLKNRLTVYNNNKLHNFKIVKYISCKSTKLMDAIEQILLAKFNKYKIISTRDVFELPESKDVSFFTQWYDYLARCCDDIEDNVDVEDRTEEENQEIEDEAIEDRKAEKSEFNKQYRKDHREDILDREQNFRNNNKEQLKERNLDYRINNVEKEKKRKAKYAEEHKEEIKERMIEYRKEKATEIAESKKKYKLEHKEENEAPTPCVCGSIVSKQYMSTHLTTDTHKKFLETGLTKDQQRKEESVKCPCGMTVTKRHLKNHEKSKIHQEFITKVKVE